jgi:hypothetical protein
MNLVTRASREWGELATPHHGRAGPFGPAALAMDHTLRSGRDVSRPRRIDGFSYTGFNRYFLTFCVKERNRAFVDGSIVIVALE